MQQLIVTFLLFFAVLAFGWFYLHRAKARATSNTAVEHKEADSAADKG